MREEFVFDKQFRGENLTLVELCDEILEEYADQGYDLSLRQLYYQLVARGHVENTQQSYKRIGTLVSDARLAGLLDWDHVVDRVRETVTPPHWHHPREIVQAAAKQFAIDKWADQPVHVEVMVEKDAVSGILEPVCRELDIPFTANRGYSSQSFMYRRGKEIREQLELGKRVLVIYLGDHDPSGLDMDRDVLARLNLFAGTSDPVTDPCESGCPGDDEDQETPTYEGRLELARIALTRRQIAHFNPPPNPAKLTDSRAAAYVRKHGDQSWELDALEPRELARLVKKCVLAVRDETLWKIAVAREAEMRERLDDVVKGLK